ncbi:hypothetical protein B566_EDAN010844, partial [Ephemera danica]
MDNAYRGVRAVTDCSIALTAVTSGRMLAKQILQLDVQTCGNHVPHKRKLEPIQPTVL